MSSSCSLPDPYTMCCRQECDDRLRSGEVSRFEYDDEYDDDDVCSRRCINIRSNGCHSLDPSRAVAKYRRNERNYPPRSLPQLHITVRYLAELLVAAPVVLAAADAASGAATTPFLSVVEFVQDRLRAVQVDVTRQQYQQTAPRLQQIMARLHVLVLYLLHDCRGGCSNNNNNNNHNNSSYYEPKFGQDALHLALANSWNHQHDNPKDIDDDEQQRDDEMFSLTLLVQLKEQLLDLQNNSNSNNNGGGTNETMLPQFCFAFTDLYRKHGSRLTPHGPCWKWTLRFISLVLLGHWSTALQHLLLRGGGGDPHDNHLSSSSLLLAATDFPSLARCCMAPSIPWLRWRALHTWNNCIGVPPSSINQRNNEGLSGMELARLLHYPTISAALADTAGLSVQDGAVRFKGPLPFPPFQPPSHLRAMVDSIVLSTMQNDHDPSPDTITNNANNDNPLQLRVTSDGILLPSEEWMRRMLLLL